MKPNPLLVLVAVIGGGWLFLQMVGACITLLGVGLGADPTFAVVAGVFIALGLALFTLTRNNR